MIPTISQASASTPHTPMQPTLPADYQAGICNIGPDEIARRRRAGHVGVAMTAAMLIGLVALGAPPILRLVLIAPAAVAASGYLQAWLKFCAAYGRLVLVAPAAVAASGYLQAWLKFCAAYGRLGVYNFGRAGRTSSVAEDAARAADRRKANQIGLASLGIGLVVAVIAVLLPV